MFGAVKQVLKRFSRQPVGVRAALIVAVIGAFAMFAVDWQEGRRDRQGRLDERHVQSRKEITEELTTVFRGVRDLSLSLGASVTLTEEADSAAIDSLRVLAEKSMFSQAGISARIGRAYGDSLAEQYSQLVTQTDELYHLSLLMFTVDTELTSPENVDVLRENVLRLALDVGRASNDFLNTLIGER